MVYFLFVANGTPDEALKSFTLRVEATMVYRRALRSSAWWLGLMAIMVLILRFMEDLPGNWWMYALGSWVALIIAAWVTEHRNRLSPEQLRAAFDRQNHAGGLVMAAAEVDTRSWEANTRELAQPTLKWRAGPAWGAVALTFVLLLAAAFVPLRFASLLSEPPLEVGEKVEELQNQIDILEEENILPAEEAEAKREELERIAESASGFNPSKTFNALDALLDNNQKLAEQEAAEAAEQLEAINEAKLLGRALELLPKDLAKELGQEDALKDLANMAQKLLEQGALDPENLPKELAEALRDAAEGMDPEQLQQLLEALGNNEEQLRDLAEKLMDNGLIPPGQLKDLAQRFNQGGGQGDIDPADLAKLLAQGGFQPGDFEELLKELAQGGPGQGGLDRGPGPAPMQYGTPSDESGTEFKEQKLQPSIPLEQAKLAGVTITAPEVTGGEAILSKGALSQAGAGGGSALTAPVLPRHRGAVSRFFDRPARPKE